MNERDRFLDESDGGVRQIPAQHKCDNSIICEACRTDQWKKMMNEKNGGNYQILDGSDDEGTRPITQGYQQNLNNSRNYGN